MSKYSCTVSVNKMESSNDELAYATEKVSWEGDCQLSLNRSDEKIEAYVTVDDNKVTIKLKKDGYSFNLEYKQIVLHCVNPQQTGLYMQYRKEICLPSCYELKEDSSTDSDSDEMDSDEPCTEVDLLLAEPDTVYKLMCDFQDLHPDTDDEEGDEFGPSSLHGHVCMDHEITMMSRDMMGVEVEVGQFDDA